MAAQMVRDTDYKAKAMAALWRVRENCHEWAIDADIGELRHWLGRAGVNLADIGTSEAELDTCFKTGHKTSAQSWLKVAKEECRFRDVSFEVGCVNSRLMEANLTLGDVGSSQDELDHLLAAHRKPIKAGR